MATETNLSFQIIHAYNKHVDIITPLFDAYRMFYGLDSNVERCTQFLAARIGVRDTIIFLAVEGMKSHKAMTYPLLQQLKPLCLQYTYRHKLLHKDKHDILYHVYLPQTFCLQ